MTAFEQLLAKLGVRAPTAWGVPLLAASAAHEINSPLRLAAFLSNVLYETTNLSTLVENLNYSAAALVATWPSRYSAADAERIGRTAQHPADQHAIAERSYGGRLGNGPEGSGDGYLFRGSGGLMTTGRTNYAAFGKTIGWIRPVEELPAYLATPSGAVESAAAFFQASGCNSVADRGDIATVRRIIQGGNLGLADVHARYPVILAALHNAQRVTAPLPPAPAIITADDLNAQELVRIRSAAA